MDTRRIVFLDREAVPAWLDFRGPAVPHELVLHPHTARDEVAGRIRDADVVITNKVVVDAQALRGAKHLGLVALAATGTDNVDLRACDELGIVVSNVRGYASRTVPEHVFALMFTLWRSLPAYRQSVIDGRWQQSGQFCYFDYPVRDLAGATLGIVGHGTLGEGVARIARSLGMKVQFAAHRGAQPAGPDYVAFDDFLQTSDIISLHCPLNEETRGMFGAAEFARMARRPLLINTARGGLVDETALGQALESGQICAAGFDVASQEPPAADHPLMRLVKYPNFLLTPHVAWTSRDAVSAMARQLIDNIEAWCAGEPRNVVAGLRHAGR